MTHAEFSAAYQRGQVKVQIDRDAARKLVSGRMMLPFLLLPIFGAGVALALTGAWLWGAGVFLAAFVFRYAVRASAHGFVLSKSLGDAKFYDEMVRGGILTLYTAS